jgi:hypothetical protein
MSEKTDPKKKRDTSDQPVRAKIHESQTAQHGDESYSREKRWIERGKVLIEALTLAAVIFYGCVAYRQWRAMIVANENSGGALEVAQSPYVFVVDINAAPLKIGEKVTGKIQFVNTGNLPARNFTFAGQFEIRPDCPTQITGTTALDINQFDMPPNLSNYADQPPQDIFSANIISDNEFTSFSNRTSKLCAYGMYLYGTGFKNPNGSDKFVIQPFCQWIDSVTAKFSRCPVLNTQFIEHPSTPTP